ncbi:hypothetical protein AX16_002175 [Volvariella volvacea WC 439]|nr:hypothetical protein AX16_002175 [Volvariella volvacea WC 439]
MSSKRVAVLLCDSLHPKVQEVNGDYPVIYPGFLQSSLPNPESNQAIVDCYDVVNAMVYPDDEKLRQYDGIVLTGSASSAYEDKAWINKLVAFVANVAERYPQIRIIGICFGHQIIARALGGTCVPNDGKWEIGPTPLDLTPLGKKIFGQDSVNIQEMHRDHVPEVLPNFYLLGSTSTCYNQGMVQFYPSVSSSSSPPSDFKLRDIHIFTVQGHPEFTESIVNSIVEIRRYVGVISDELAQDVERRKYWRNDGVPVIGKAIWGVLGVDA